MCRSMRAIPRGTSWPAAASARGSMTGSHGGVSSTRMHASRVGVSTPLRRMYSSALLDIGAVQRDVVVAAAWDMVGVVSRVVQGAVGGVVVGAVVKVCEGQ